MINNHPKAKSNYKATEFVKNEKSSIFSPHPTV
jgi:hypothetical protein